MTDHWSEKETRWSRIRRRQGNRFSFLSKFQTDEARITLEEITREWPAWNLEERLDFISAYNCKPSYEEEEFKIIEFLMKHAGTYELSALPRLVTQLPDKKRALRFILDQIREVKPEEIVRDLDIGVANFYQAAGNLGDREAIPLLKSKISEMLEYPGLFYRVSFCLICALEALYKLEPNEEYKRLIEGFKLHPHETVAQIAVIALENIKREYEKTLHRVEFRWN